MSKAIDLTLSTSPAASVQCQAREEFAKSVLIIQGDPTRWCRAKSPCIVSRNTHKIFRWKLWFGTCLLSKAFREFQPSSQWYYTPEIYESRTCKTLNAHTMTAFLKFLILKHLEVKKQIWNPAQYCRCASDQWNWLLQLAGNSDWKTSATS